MTERTKRLVGAIAAVAREWMDVDHPERVAAEEETLSAPNRFTEEALVFAINQQMNLLREEALFPWADELESEGRRVIGVLNPGNVPLAGLTDLLAVSLAGHAYAGAVSSKSPALLPAFAHALEDAGAPADISFHGFDTLLEHADALIASGSDETVRVISERALAAGIPRDRVLVRGHRFSVAVLDGRETEEERIGLAEDMLLHEGRGCRNVALVWAPYGSSPDPYLEAMAAFRETFPAHPESGKALELQRAYLEAVGIPHAWGEDLGLLLSKGEPESLPPLHVRWSEYGSVAEAISWVREQGEAVQLVVMSERLAFDNLEGVERVSPGNAQRPELGWTQDRGRLTSFLRSFGS